MITVECEKDCGVYLSYPCNPKAGQIGKLFVAFKTVAKLSKYSRIYFL